MSQLAYLPWQNLVLHCSHLNVCRPRAMCTSTHHVLNTVLSGVYSRFCIAHAPFHVSLLGLTCTFALNAHTFAFNARAFAFNARAFEFNACVFAFHARAFAFNARAFVFHACVAVS